MPKKTATKPQTSKKHQKLGEWFATAICGNDILSSALYVSGIAVIYAGIFAPLVLLFIAFVLFLYKKVYTEVVEALPVNGGAYNCLLNGTSKMIAGLAGVTTFLSYVATAVISAKVGIEYLYSVEHFIPVIPVTIALLFAFALLVISGIKDSAKVAFGIFILHIVTLSLFVILALVHYFQGHSYLMQNWTHTLEILKSKGGLISAFYLAFSASLLGVSGFESSANFVEEQERGVFRKTLRNMLLGVAIFNPLIALAVLNSLPIDSIIAAKDFLLADAARVIGGTVFQYVVVVDAFLVLSGAVLTAYVGVSGLLQRMAADGCLPNFLTVQNKKGSYPRIVITFFILCSSILLITHGDLLSLAGVYTIAFLTVMSLFAFGNLILKQTRTELKRTYNASILVVVIALLATVFGIFGNIRINPSNLTFFELYFIPVALLALLMVYQDYVIQFLVKMTERIPFIHKVLVQRFRDVTEGTYVVFIHNVSRLYSTLQYINQNETGRNIIIVHCKNQGSNKYDRSFQDLLEALPWLRKAGMYPHLNLSILYKNEPFGPEVIDKVAKELNVRKNRILIGSIHHSHDFEYDQLGGVRIIFG